MFAQRLIVTWLVLAIGVISPSAADGVFVFVSNQDDATVSVVDTATDTVVATVPVAFAPAGLAADRTGRSRHASDRGEISVNDVAERRVVRALGIGGSPFGIALGQNGSLFVSDWRKNTVTAPDPDTGRRLREIAVGRGPAGIVASPGGILVFVANRESDTVTIINTGSLAVVATLPVGNAPFALAVSPDGGRLYVANVQSADVSIISTETLQQVGSVKVGPMPYGLATSTNGTRPYSPRPACPRHTEGGPLP